jgi:hypothetical protein
MHMQPFNVDEVYAKTLAECLRTLHSEATLAKRRYSLHQFILGARGAYPVDVVAMLQQLNVPYYEDKWAHDLSTGSWPVEVDIPRKSITSIFADPHPADYDWRFTTANIPVLVEALAESSRGGAIALLGTKTLFSPLYDKGAQVTLFNKSAALLSDLRQAGYQKGLVEWDLCQPLADGVNKYQVAFADPPWYPDYYQAFLQRASELLVVDGTLYLSVLPVLTRPSAVVDRADILQQATQAGFDLVRQEPGMLSYETPLFERQALSAQHLSCTDWRLGDLWIFQKVRRNTPIQPQETPVGEPQWDEYRIGTKRIKVRLKTGREERLFAYRPADPTGNVFTQVSRRSPFRNQIDVWGSDNQAYTVDRPSILKQSLSELERAGSLESVVDILKKNKDVSSAECAELIALLQRLVQ